MSATRGSDIAEKARHASGSEFASKLCLDHGLIPDSELRFRTPTLTSGQPCQPWCDIARGATSAILLGIESEPLLEDEAEDEPLTDNLNFCVKLKTFRPNDIFAL